MKLTKVAFAIASVLAVAAGSAHAGQIDSSSATLAHRSDQEQRSDRSFALQELWLCR